MGINGFLEIPVIPHRFDVPRLPLDRDNFAEVDLSPPATDGIVFSVLFSRPNNSSRFGIIVKIDPAFQPLWFRAALLNDLSSILNHLPFIFGKIIDVIEDPQQFFCGF